MRLLIVFASGLLFSVGLALGGMTQPTRVLGFLDITGTWDPSLVFVMAGAILVHAPLARWTMRHSAIGKRGGLRLAMRTAIDRRLVGGAAIFGVGWGLAGYCPGPALASLVTGAPGVLAFLLAMAAGMWLAGRWQRLTTRPAPHPMATTGAD